MAPLACDPAALEHAGAEVVTAGEGLGSVISTLTAALSGCAGMAGDDPVGAALGHSYDNSAAKLIEAMAATRNGLCSLGDGVRMSAHNYSLAEAMSNVGGGGGPLPTPSLTAPMSAASAPSSVGTGTGAPAGWGWVAPYIGMIWPTGDSAKLRAAAAAWSSAGTQFALAEILGTGGPMGAIRAQQIPEGPAIDRAFTDAFSSTTSLVQQCQTMAAQLTSYAAKVDQVHAAILDLLARICDPSTGIKEVWEFLTDEDEDEIKKIADDIRAVVGNFSAEASALRSEIASTLAAATTIVTDMGRHAAREWDQFLHGTDVGRAINQVGQYAKGAWSEAGGMLKGIWDVSTFRMMFDPIGYGRDMANEFKGALPLVGLGGPHAPSIGESWKQLGKGVVHWDEWDKNPAEAAGRSVVDIATLALPGGPLSKLGKLGRLFRGEKPPLPDLPKPPSFEPPKPPVEPPPVPRPPESGNPPPAPKPAPGPANGPLPHSPTESKPPVVEKPPAGEPSKPVAVPTGPAGKPPVAAPVEQAPLTHSKPPEPVHVPASPIGNPGEPVPSSAFAQQPAPAAPAAAAPHLPAAPAGGLPAEAPSPFGAPPHGGEPPVHPPESHPPHGGSPHQPGDGAPPPHQPGDGAPPHQPGDGDKPPGSHQPHDGSPPDDGADGHPADVPSPSDLKPWHQAQLALAESPEQLVNDLIRHGCPRELAESAMHSPYEGMNAQEILNAFWDPAKGTWKWPEANGFADGKWETARSIPTEASLDRIGEVSDTRGDFMGTVGDSYPDRGLAPGSSGDYNRFHGTGKELPDRWEVRFGKVADAFGQPGGGTQWVVIDEEGETVLISFLIDNGYLAWG
ncbi:NAD(+)--arginine ADP-ribosyltransferase [Mycobacterium sp. 1554424.7]|nr:NAD(+)--arginine ADP-ribosyltransferase [Mycobacterium sp. 1554424.7]